MTMSKHVLPPEIIPIKNWLYPARRNEFDVRFGVAFGPHGYEFEEGQYGLFLGVAVLAKGVLQEVARRSEIPSTDLGIRPFSNFDNPGDTFSGGTLLFIGASREVIDRHHSGVVA